MVLTSQGGRKGKLTGRCRKGLTCDLCCLEGSPRSHAWLQVPLPGPVHFSPPREAALHRRRHVGLMDEVGLGTQSHLPALYPDSFFTAITGVFRGTFSDGPHPDLWPPQNNHKILNFGRNFRDHRAVQLLSWCGIPPYGSAPRTGCLVGVHSNGRLKHGSRAPPTVSLLWAPTWW